MCESFRELQSCLPTGYDYDFTYRAGKDIPKQRPTFAMIWCSAAAGSGFCLNRIIRQTTLKAEGTILWLAEL